MPADPSTIPATVLVTNLMTDPLKLEGLPVFAVGEARTVTMTNFLLPQRAWVWNAIRNAKVKNLVTTNSAVVDVTSTPTGQQGVENNGGQGG
jgi:hypothetical protein